MASSKKINEEIMVPITNLIAKAQKEGSVQASALHAELEKLDMEGVGKTVEALRGAAQKLAEVDIDAVNDGIEALTDAAGNLQNLDIEKLNDLIAALEKTAAQMEKTSAAFGKLFGK